MSILDSAPTPIPTLVDAPPAAPLSAANAGLLQQWAQAPQTPGSPGAIAAVQAGGRTGFEDIPAATRGQLATPNQPINAPAAAPGLQVAYQGAGAPAAAAPVVALPPAASGPGRPAGYVPTTREVERKSGLETDRSGLASAQEDVANTQSNLGNATRQADLDEPDAAAAQAKAIAAKQNALAYEQATKQKLFDNGLADEAWKADRAHATFDDARKKGIDPNHYYHSKSTLGNLATIAAVALGTFGTGVQGIFGQAGQNTALDAINRAINTDVQAQRDELERKGHAAEMADNHYAVFKKEGMSDLQASAQSKMKQLQDYGEQLKAQAANAPPMVQLRLAQHQAEIAKAYGDEKLKYEKETQAQVTTKAAEKYQAAQAGGGGDDWAAAYRKYRAAEIGKLDPKTGLPAHLDSPGEFRARWQGGNEGVRPDTSKTGKVSPRLGVRLASINDAEAALDKVGALEGGSWHPTQVGQAEGKVAVANARTALLESGIPPGEVDRVLPPDYSPSSAHVTGAHAAMVQAAKGLIAQQKKVVQSAVDMSRGSGEAETAEP